MAKKTSKKASKKPARKPVKKVASKTVKKTVAEKPASKATNKPATAATVKKSATINPYLTFNGNCEEAFNFYKSAFGGQFGYVGRFKEMPPMDGKTVPPEEGEKIMHVSLRS